MTRPEDRDDAPGRLLEILGRFAQDSGLSIPPGSLTLETRLEADLGLDSLGRAELIARLEKGLGVLLPDRALLVATPRDLLAMVEDAAPTSTRIGPWVGQRDSPDSTFEYPPPALGTLTQVLDWHLRRHPGRVHILSYREDEPPLPMTYADLAEGAMRAAGALRRAGLREGAAVALMLPTGPDYFFGFFGVLAAGGIPVPIYPPARIAQIEDHLRRHTGILDNAQAALLITVPEARAVARLLKVLVPSLKEVLTPAALADGPPLETAAQTGADAIALLQYTSGSTGDPKGVILTHADLLANIRAMGEALGVRPDDRFVSWLPLYHDMGLIGAWLGSLYFGIPLVSLSPLAFLARPLRWLQAIHEHRGTLSAAPNFAYELCLKRIGDQAIAGLDLRCWRRAFNGAEPVSAETLRRFSERFAACGLSADALAPVYGLAEAAVGLSFPPQGRGPRVDWIDRGRLAEIGHALPVPPDDPQAMAVVGCGQPLPGYRVRILDGSGRVLPDRHEGLLQFQGPSATRGYFRNPEATARLIRDGWHETGDRAYLADGEIHLTGRVKDLIIRGGRNLYPYEVEEAIGGLPGIRKGCVVAFAAPDPKQGSERLVLVAETRERDPARRAALERTVRERATEVLGLPPDEILLAPPRSVPKTSSGKLRRVAARELYLAGRLLGGPAPPLWQLLRVGASGLVGSAARWLGGIPARLYAGYVWMCLVLIAPWVWLGILILPRLEWRWALVRLGVGLLRRLARVPLEVSGRQHLPPPGRPFVVAANHQSYLDAMVLIEAIVRPIAFVAKKELAANPLLRVALIRLGTHFVERFDPLRGAEDSDRFAAALHRGEILGFFPEGTFRDQPGLLPFRMGAFFAATGAGVPLVPVAVVGTRELMRGNRFVPSRGRAAVFIGEPLQPSGNDWAAAVALRDLARGFILERGLSQGERKPS